MKRFAIVITCLLGMVSSVFANEIVPTDQGVIVILKDDGTWEILESTVDDSDIMLVEDLVLDAILLKNETVTTVLDITSCSDELCVVKDWVHEIFIDTENLPSAVRETLSRKCQTNKYCRTSITGTVKHFNLFINLEATSVEFD